MVKEQLINNKIRRDIKLNIGCGADIKEGYVNVDGVDHKGVDVVHDLNKLPYPFKSSSIKEIIAFNILEHLDNINEVMEELYRILEPKGIIKIKVPHYSSCFVAGDPTHRRAFSYQTFSFWSDEFLTPDNWLAKAQFKIIDRRIVWGANKLRKIDIITPVINIFPAIYERFLSWIIPSEEVWVTLQKP